eukprot:scaffold79966_cov32-Tisochrysis_lutea.AAC.1
MKRRHQATAHSQHDASHEKYVSKEHANVLYSQYLDYDRLICSLAHPCQGSPSTGGGFSPDVKTIIDDDDDAMAYAYAASCSNWSLGAPHHGFPIIPITRIPLFPNHNNS